MTIGPEWARAMVERVRKQKYGEWHSQSRVYESWHDASAHVDDDRIRRVFLMMLARGNVRAVGECARILLETEAMEFSRWYE